MFRQNNDKARENQERIVVLGEKSGDLSTTADTFLDRARQMHLAKQGWSDYAKNLDAAAKQYASSSHKKDLESYEERLLEACKYLEGKSGKNKRVNVNETLKRMQLLRGHEEKIRQARMSPFAFLHIQDLSPSETSTSSVSDKPSSLLRRNSGSVAETSPESTQVVTKVSIVAEQSVTTDNMADRRADPSIQGYRIPVEDSEADNKFSLKEYGKSFFGCCRPRHSSNYQSLSTVEDQKQFEKSYTRITPTKRS